MVSYLVENSNLDEGSKNGTMTEAFADGATCTEIEALSPSAPGKAEIHGEPPTDPKVRPKRKKRTKLEDANAREILIADINKNGPIHPLEYARKYDRSTMWVSKTIAQAACRGELDFTATTSYEVKEASGLKKWQRELIGAEPGDLIRIEGGEGVIMISIIR